MGLLAEPDGSADWGMHLSHLVNQRQMSILVGEKRLAANLLRWHLHLDRISSHAALVRGWGILPHSVAELVVLFAASKLGVCKQSDDHISSPRIRQVGEILDPRSTDHKPQTIRKTLVMRVNQEGM